MKKIIFLFACVMTILLTSCNSCGSQNQETEKKDSVEAKGGLVVENLISTDRQHMFLHYKNDYRWYETCILMKNFLDEEDNEEIAGVSNVFQYIFNEVETETETSFDVNVVLFSHTPDTTAIEVKDGFWVGDSPLNEEEIKVTFAEAFEKLMESNYPKPHSRHCVLRREVGPIGGVAPQYIFGNQKAQIYVDAKTGNVTDKNPAFGDFGMPLGEWP